MTDTGGITHGPKVSERLRSRVERLRIGVEGALADIERMRLDASKGHVRQSRAVVVAVALVAGCAFVAGANGSATVVKAPFTLKGKNGPIALIEGDSVSSRLSFFGKLSPIGAPPVATVEVTDTRSYFLAETPSKKVNMGTELGVDGTTPYLRLSDQGKERLSLDVTNGKPFVRIKGADGHGVVELGQTDGGGGQLRLAKPGGTVMVLAGVSAEGVGRVETGPFNDVFPRGSPIGAFIVGVK